MMNVPLEELQVKKCDEWDQKELQFRKHEDYAWEQWQCLLNQEQMNQFVTFFKGVIMYGTGK